MLFCFLHTYCTFCSAHSPAGSSQPAAFCFLFLGFSCFQPGLIHLELLYSTSSDADILMWMAPPPCTFSAWRYSFSGFVLYLSNPVGSEGSDPCVHPCAMKQSPVGELAMDREQLRGCSQSLLMQEVRRRELSPGFSLNTGQRTRQTPTFSCG
jgi:hypothetical protein